MTKSVWIAGNSRQDGAMDKGYGVHGSSRRPATFATERLDGISPDAHTADCRPFMHDGDLNDGVTLIDVPRDAIPGQVCDLESQSQIRGCDVEDERSGRLVPMDR